MTELILTEEMQRIVERQNIYFSDATHRSALLQWYANKFGDFKVATFFGNDKWSKHISVLAIQESDERWRLEKAGHREIFENEIVIDFDREKNETAEQIQQRVFVAIVDLVKDDCAFKAYFSGSKGYHIHILVNVLKEKDRREREFYKKALIEKYHADLHKAYDRALIALEFAPHWKTGNQKVLIFDNSGVDLYDRLSW